MRLNKLFIVFSICALFLVGCDEDDNQKTISSSSNTSQTSNSQPLNVSVKEIDFISKEGGDISYSIVYTNDDSETILITIAQNPSVSQNLSKYNVLISSLSIDSNGDLMIYFNDDQVFNAGHVKDLNEYFVSFYCEDLLVATQTIKEEQKATMPMLNEFDVEHWFKDKELISEWDFDTDVVKDNISLYGDFVALPQSINFTNENHIDLDEYGFGTTNNDSKEICVSKADEISNYFCSLQERGILFNKAEIGLIQNLTINISNDEFQSAKIFYGNTPLNFSNYRDLTKGSNVINLEDYEYFVIQNTGENTIGIDSLELDYVLKTKFINKELPTVTINTKDSAPVDSRTEYVDCTVSTIGSEKDVSELKAEIKIRGNSTAYCPKKPYSIKLDKKNSLFGYEKAKNWVLLADYMDASNMHNFSALKFAKMVRGEESFAVEPVHVNVVLNGENLGLYEFGEHIDAKEGRLDMEQNKIWQKDFDDINFYIERDLSAAGDSEEIEEETFFKIKMEDYTPSEYVFALKYHEKEDFEEKISDTEINYHETEFYTFFNNLKDYVTDICNRFVAYTKDTSSFTDLSSVVDVESLAEFAMIDQAFKEADHGQKSYKMYRKSGGLLKFGPNWDYDSCTLGLPFEGTYILNPFAVGSKWFKDTYFGDLWGRTLFNDNVNGKPLFKKHWDKISNDDLSTFVNAQLSEIGLISSSSIYDCGKWMNNQYYCLFDNIQYHYKWVSTQLPFLKNYYSSL